MLAITARSYTDPSGYELSEIPLPRADGPRDVIFQVHAASVNPVDVKLVGGVFKAGLSQTFPLQIGYDCAGIVTEVGADVTEFKTGDHVWSRLPEVSRGSWAEYAKCTADFVAHKPSSLSFAESASMPLAALTAMQALRRYDGSLEGKTVFIPAGLGGTGAFACQLAKNVCKAGKVITTVSTSKVNQVSTCLGEGVVDQIIDYTREDPMTVIPQGSLDFVLDTMGQAMDLLSLMVPSTGTIVSISTAPSGTQLQNASFFKRPDQPRLGWPAWAFLNTMDAVRKLRAWRWSVRYSYMFLESTATELEQLAECVDNGLLRPVIGTTVPLQDVEAVKDACLQVYRGKGGFGKTVFVMDSKR